MARGAARAGAAAMEAASTDANTTPLTHMLAKVTLGTVGKTMSATLPEYANRDDSCSTGLNGSSRAKIFAALSLDNGVMRATGTEAAATTLLLSSMITFRRNAAAPMTRRAMLSPAAAETATGDDKYLPLSSVSVG